MKVLMSLGFWLRLLVTSNSFMCDTTANSLPTCVGQMQQGAPHAGQRHLPLTGPSCTHPAGSTGPSSVFSRPSQSLSCKCFVHLVQVTPVKTEFCCASIKTRKNGVFFKIEEMLTGSTRSLPEHYALRVCVFSSRCKSHRMFCLDLVLSQTQRLCPL